MEVRGVDKILKKLNNKTPDKLLFIAHSPCARCSMRSLYAVSYFILTNNLTLLSLRPSERSICLSLYSSILNSASYF